MIIIWFNITFIKRFLVNFWFCKFNKINGFSPFCTIFKFYHINAEKSLSTDFSPHF
ncbi:hypothetical protein [Spiroplasma ixodetis]|uniref:hypothetical protein n=1 Tax=Spiroplasma ixodetis TaxID=2141 RepID=UPI00257500D6|nr:hypothetical protein [Spiroplasma ixodetis]